MPATVAQIVEDLGPALITGAAGDLSAEFERVDVTDPAFPSRPCRAVLLVAPGFRVDDGHFAQLLSDASAGGAAGVVVKAESALSQDQRAVAVVCIDPAADWGQRSVGHQLRASGRRPGPGVGHLLQLLHLPRQPLPAMRPRMGQSFSTV